MKLPRLNLGWLMIGVALVAIHLAIVQKMMSWPAPVIHDLILGALPMAALVAIGTVLIYTRPDVRPFFLGFAVFGSMALALFALLAVLFNDTTLRPYTTVVFKPLSAAFRRTEPFVYFTIAYPVAVFLLLIPQLIFALIGGWLSTKYKVCLTIARRKDS